MCPQHEFLRCMVGADGCSALRPILAQVDPNQLSAQRVRWPPKHLLLWHLRATGHRFGGQGHHIPAAALQLSSSLLHRAAREPCVPTACVNTCHTSRWHSTHHSGYRKKASKGGARLKFIGVEMPGVKFAKLGSRGILLSWGGGLYEIKFYSIISSIMPAHPLPTFPMS